MTYDISYWAQMPSLAMTNRPSLTHFTFKLVPRSRSSPRSVMISYCIVFCISWCWWRWRRRRLGWIWGICVTWPSVKFICLWRWNNGPSDSGYLLSKRIKKKKKSCTRDDHLLHHTLGAITPIPPPPPPPLPPAPPPHWNPLWSSCHVGRCVLWNLKARFN